MDFASLPDIPAGLSLVEYDLATGAIRSWREMPRDEFDGLPPMPGCAFLEVEGRAIDGSVYRVTNGQITERPTLQGFDKTAIAADGQDVARLDLPEPMLVWVEGEVHGPTDVVEIVTAMPGTYRVAVAHFPYQAYTAEIVAS